MKINIRIQLIKKLNKVRRQTNKQNNLLEKIKKRVIMINKMTKNSKMIRMNKKTKRHLIKKVMKIKKQMNDSVNYIYHK